MHNWPTIDFDNQTKLLYPSLVMPDCQPVQSTPIKHPTGNNRGLHQAYDFRDLAATEAMALKDTPCETLTDKLARAKALQCLAIVWRDASDRIRILRNRPLPGSLRPEHKPKKQKQPPITPEE